MFTNVDILLYSYYLTFAVSRGAWLLNGPNVTVTFRSGGGKFYQFGLWSEQVRPGLVMWTLHSLARPRIMLVSQCFLSPLNTTKVCVARDWVTVAEEQESKVSIRC